MNYTNYEISIVQAYNVKLIGWPLDGDVVSPTQTTDMRKLRNTLKSGECR